MSEAAKKDAVKKAMELAASDGYVGAWMAHSTSGFWLLWRAPPIAGSGRGVARGQPASGTGRV